MTNSTRYHHGNLREQLLIKATTMVEDIGVEHLSMRKLGDELGVSRTALYHHFKNKQELLAAVASLGFEKWQQQCIQTLQNNALSDEDKLQQYVTTYLTYSIENPQIYELMFGKTIWGNDQSTDQLKTIAYDNFNFHLAQIKEWQSREIIHPHEDSLRLAQVSWAALHGLSRLFIDGVYINKDNLSALADTIVHILQPKL